MNMEETIKQAEKNIKQAMTDYLKYTDRTETLSKMSDEFVSQLAKDSSYAKQGLRELFSKSPNWNPELDAIVLDCVSTYYPNYERVFALAHKILYDKMTNETVEMSNKITAVIYSFVYSDTQNWLYNRGISTLKELAPKAYAPNKKPSRVFRDFCTALGVTDERAGSEFQKLYAQLSDELNKRQAVNIKLFLSINPAHFLTMSNPKGDSRGETLISCQSLNSTTYSYTCGCSGYARDKTSFIVFTAEDPSNPESLNNRKTTRQMFAYRPGSGVLLQSRMYNTSGGTSGSVEESKTYLDMVRKEIASLEGAANIWEMDTTAIDENEREDSEYVETGEGFGGYRDWIYPDFCGRISIREDHEDDWKPITVGSEGLCICCGKRTSKGLFCEKHDPVQYCDWCETQAEELWAARGQYGEHLLVCRNCLDEDFCKCSACDEYFPDFSLTEVDGEYYCDDCLEGKAHESDSNSVSQTVPPKAGKKSKDYSKHVKIDKRSIRKNRKNKRESTGVRDTQIQNTREERRRSWGLQWIIHRTLLH